MSEEVWAGLCLGQVWFEGQCRGGKGGEGVYGGAGEGYGVVEAQGGYA